MFRPQHVRPRTVASIAETFALELRGDGAVEIAGVASSSSGVRADDLFVALPGAHTHGASFAQQAIAAGAVAVLTDAAGAERISADNVPLIVTEDPRGALGPVASFVYGTGAFADDHAEAIVFGVTGTNGKTSVAYLLAAIGAQLGRSTALSSTAERRIADEVSDGGLTTPEANEIHALLATAAERDVRTAVIEVSAHALTRHRVDGVAFDVVGFTNLSHDHLDDYASMEDYYGAKRELFTPERARRGVVCVDDTWAERLIGESRIPITTVSTRAGADWLVTVLDENARGTTFELSGLGRTLTVSVPLLGAFSATNAALAMVMWVEAGIDLDYLASALDGFIQVSVPGRTEIVSGNRGPLVLVDYAHTPDAFSQLLAALRRVTIGELIMVFGADGDRDRSKRAAMGAHAALGADRLVITDFHPRHEEPAGIRAALIAGAREAQPDVRIDEIPDPREAIRFAIAVAEEHDVVVYAGPGHEEYHEVAGVKIPYSARAEARAALRENGWLDD